MLIAHVFLFADMNSILRFVCECVGGSLVLCLYCAFVISLD